MSRSLRDVVTQITGIRAEESVPDSIIDRADVEVVDLLPEDLIRRLREGKIYLPEQAEHAISHYFSLGKLTALRELTLRRAAQRIDGQMLLHMRAQGIDGPWAAGERILVCVDGGPAAAASLRYARRLADRLRAPWTAIHVETPRSQRLSEREREGVADNFRMAQRLGGEAMTLAHQDVAQAVLEFARSNNFTHIVTARRDGAAWSRWPAGSVVDRLIRQAGRISVHVTGEDRDAFAAVAGSARLAKGVPGVPQGVDAVAYAGSGLMAVAALACGLLLQQVFASGSVALIFLMAVLASAVSYGLGPSLFASALSVILYNIFFLPPLYIFTPEDPDNFVSLFFFVLASVTGSKLAARVRDQTSAARHRVSVNEELYRFCGQLTAAVSLEDLLGATGRQIATMLELRVVLLLPDRGSLVARTMFPPEIALSEADMAAATWCWSNNRPAGRGADTLGGGQWLFLPLRTTRGAIGVVGLDSERPGPLLAPEQRRLLDTLTGQAALAIERVALAEDVERARIGAETERLRAALLTSISHDLRTPLASILGSATSLRRYRQALDDATQEELIGTIQDEAERLNRFIANLLDMTRLEAGAIRPRADPSDLADIIGSALRRAEKVLPAGRLEVDLAPDLPLVAVDAVLLEQVLFNLLDNAAKYTPAGSLVRIEGRQEEDGVRLQLLDRGEGIPPAELDRIFDKFYRVEASDRRRAGTGTGLGLAICRGFIEAMGGAIGAGNRRDGTGAVFTIRLPAAPVERPSGDHLSWRTAS